jgi:hypothetical protein
VIDQVTAWQEVAAQLGIAITAPCEIRLADGTRVHASAHIENFGAENGMIADPDWGRIAPYAKALVANGYGFSRVALGPFDRERIIELLADWGWSALQPAPAWLPAIGGTGTD